MATKSGGKNPWPERNVLLGSKVMHGSAKVNQRSNSLEMPCGHQILVERTPDQSVMHWWGQRSCKGQLGKIAYKCVRPSNEANAAEHYAAAGALVYNKKYFTKKTIIRSLQWPWIVALKTMIFQTHHCGYFKCNSQTTKYKKTKQNIAKKKKKYPPTAAKTLRFLDQFHKKLFHRPQPGYSVH